MSNTFTQIYLQFVFSVKYLSTTKKWIRGRFSWQEGYGGFSYSHSHIGRVIRYGQNQVTHHEQQTFRNEYMGLLKKFEIEFKDNYLFEFFD